MDVKSGTEGFTLIELLIAISLLAFGLLATATLLSAGISGGRFTHMVTVESSIASSVAEELLSRAPSDAVFSSPVSAAVYDLDTAGAGTTVTEQGRIYSATYSVTPSNPVPGVSTIAVTVTSGTRNITLSFMKGTL